MAAYLFESRKKQIQTSSNHRSLPKCLPQPGLDQAKARRQKPHPGLPPEGQDPSTQALMAAWQVGPESRARTRTQSLCCGLQASPAESSPLGQLPAFHRWSGTPLQLVLPWERPGQGVPKAGGHETKSAPARNIQVDRAARSCSLGSEGPEQGVSLPSLIIQTGTGLPFCKDIPPSFCGPLIFTNRKHVPILPGKLLLRLWDSSSRDLQNSIHLLLVVGGV